MWRSGGGVRVGCVFAFHKYFQSNEAGTPVGFALTNCPSVRSLLNTRGSTESRD
jgi:hypothetical protein